MNPLAILFNCFSKAAWELQTSCSKAAFMRATGDFLKTPGECIHSFGSSKIAICHSHVSMEQLFYTASSGLGKSLKILKHFARGKIKFINYI
jgi:hypothetical protein